MSTGASSLASPTLVGLIWPSKNDVRFAALRATVLVLVGTALLTLSAKVQVPFHPVPMTMQTLVVLVIGAAYGWRLGATTVALYLAQGVMGLPVFANTPPMVASLAYFAGPTGGFLLGFLPAALVTGFMAEKGFDRSLLRIVAMMTIGHVVIFAFGLGWMSMAMPFAKAWMLGAVPFFAATILKTALAAALMQAAGRIVRRKASI